LKAIYKTVCPNCGGEEANERLQAGLPCEACFPLDAEPCLFPEKLKALREFCGFKDRVAEFERFFSERFGAKPWELQIYWARRLLLGRSFSILAPTGVGKTTFGVAAALFLKGKSYIILPTSILVAQVEKLAQRLGGKNILAYYAGLPNKTKSKIKEQIRRGEFKILVTTSAFVSKNFSLLEGKRFNFIFVDDVDSLLKRAKNVDKILMLLGFSAEQIRKAMEVVEKGKGEMSSSSEGKGLLVVSSATAKPKTRRVKLFRLLLNFEVGMPLGGLRNVEDIIVYPKNSLLEEAKNLIERFGGGALLFIPSDFGKEKIGETIDGLRKNGIEAESYEKLDEEVIRRFQEGKIHVLVGISSSRNPLARGIDLPQHVRYAIFMGVPKNRIKLDFENLTIPQCIAVLIAIKAFLDPKKANQHLWRLSKYRGVDTSRVESARRLLLEVRRFIAESLSNPEVLKRIEESSYAWLDKTAEGFTLITADAAGYLQASGRTSRLFAGGISKGAAFLLVDNVKALNDLKRKLAWFLEDVRFNDMEDLNVEEVFRVINRDRERIRNLKTGIISDEEKKFVRALMVVVESPNKARTIASFFGRPAKRRIGNLTVYEVNAENYVINIVATGGHIFDLTVGRGLHGVEVNEYVIPVFETIKKCENCGEQFTGENCPKCKSIRFRDKMEIVNSLRELAKEVDEVILATDPDTEGEKIAYDIALMLKAFNKNISRAEFHEVTRKAFREALKTRRQINLHLVEGQILRRVADRWVGFELSQILWKVFGNVRLSAGRVQTPVLGWIIERVEEAKRKHGVVRLRSESVEVKLIIPDEAKAKEVFEKTENFTVKIEKETIEAVNPPPPLSTDTMIREASKILKFDADTTMRLAQDLFEAGIITYHRTDSIRVSTVGMAVAQRYMVENGMENLFEGRKWSEIGTHECIRPTRPLDVEQVRLMIYSGILKGKLTVKHLRLYNLIFRRFMASQTVKARVKKKIIKIQVEGYEEEKEFLTEILEEGFYRFIPVKIKDLSEGTFKVTWKNLKLVPSKLYFTQGTIIELMKERNIGRPSTYAVTISKLLEHRYIIERKQFLFPTGLGVKVYRYLSENFRNLVSEEFTRRLEEDMDLVEQGKTDCNQKLLAQYQNLRERLSI
jgi:reverse gyrase